MSSLFLNSGLLGHHSVAEILREVTAHLPHLDAHHVNLSQSINTQDRVIRKLLTLSVSRTNSDYARFRAELALGLIAARHIREFRREHELTLLHFHTQPTAYASLRLMRRVPSIVSIDTTQELASLEAPDHRQRLTFAPNIAWDRKVFRAARAIVSTSAWAARDLARNYPESAQKVTVIPYPVRLQWFSESWLAERQSRSRAPTVFLFMGNDFSRKGGPELLEVWRTLNPPHATLRIATGAKTKLPDLPPGVEAIRGTQPHTPEWQQLWRDADAFVLPTRAEAFGMVFQEAAAAGLPAIGTNLNAIPEIIADNETGILVPPADVPALARAIEALNNSRDLRLALGTAARRNIAATGTTAHYAAQLDRLCGEAALNR